MKSRYLLVPFAASAFLSGCANMSGLDASTSFSCKAAPGVTCQSISGVHQNASQGALPFQTRGDANVNANGSDQEKSNSEQTEQAEKPRYGASKDSGKVSPRDMPAASSGMPVRQPPLVLRVWMAPYESDTGDLHDQSFFYTMVHSGKWMIEANRSNIASQYRPIYPLNRATAETQDQEVKEKHPLIQKGNYEGLVQKTEQ